MEVCNLWEHLGGTEKASSVTFITSATEATFSKLFRNVKTGKIVGLVIGNGQYTEVVEEEHRILFYRAVAGKEGIKCRVCAYKNRFVMETNDTPWEFDNWKLEGVFSIFKIAKLE